MNAIPRRRRLIYATLRFVLSSQSIIDALLVRFRLPYRLYLDEGEYQVAVEGQTWTVALVDLPQSRFPGPVPGVIVPRESQLWLDSWGFLGLTEVSCFLPIDPPSPVLEAVSPSQAVLRRALRAINRVISLYRRMTVEFWVRNLGSSDVPAYETLVRPNGGEQFESAGFSMPTPVAVGIPRLKSEDWYENFRDTLSQADTHAPFWDVWAEGRDALERENHRLALCLFPLAVENLFKVLLTSRWPQESLDRPVQQLLARFYRRIAGDVDASSLPLSKKEASRLLAIVWKHRNDSLHGTFSGIDRREVEQVAEASRRLLDLACLVPGERALPMGGAFSGSRVTWHKSQEALRRAKSRLAAGYSRDALEAARLRLRSPEQDTPEDIEVLHIAAASSLELGLLADAKSFRDRILRLRPDDPHALSLSPDLDR